MAIKIRQTPYRRDGGPHIGPYQVHPDLVRSQLIVIAMAGQEDLPDSLGEDPDPAEVEFTVISFDPGPQDMTVPAGRVRHLLKDLVDRAGAVRIFGVGPDFVWSDGATLEGSAGGAIGDWIFYDTQNCDGDGRWVRGTDGNEVCTTSAGILFHELGHVFLNHPSGTVDDDERAAVGVENDLRDAQGLVRRDPDHWPESDCGCPGGDCCIVASVATGSPYSAEVHALRRIRDRALRNTDLGAHLFDVLHQEYYRFSVPICRVMVVDSQLRQNIAAWLVEPLVRAWQIAWEYTLHPDDPRHLGRLIAQDHGRRFGLQDQPGFAWSLAQQLLRQAAQGQAAPALLPQLDPGTRRAYEILAAELPHCPHVRWGIVDLLQLYVEARSRYDRSPDEGDVGQWLALALDDWVGDIPLDYVLAQMSLDDLLFDLQILAGSLFVRPRVRLQLGQRLVEHLDVVHDPYIAARLREGGYLP